LDEIVASWGCEIEHHQLQAVISRLHLSQRLEAARVWNGSLSFMFHANGSEDTELSQKRVWELSTTKSLDLRIHNVAANGEFDL
jgi:hypothetical protein